MLFKDMKALEKTGFKYFQDRFIKTVILRDKVI